MSLFTLGETTIDAAALMRELVRSTAGACVTFEGWVRDRNDGRAVLRLDYQAYAPLALSEGARILAEATQRFSVVEARCAHRLVPLQSAIWPCGSVSAPAIAMPHLPPAVTSSTRSSSA
jgi:molybdopterin synthase catalytic subunit